VSVHRSNSKNFEVLTAGLVRLSRSPARSYRSWSAEEKVRIIAEARVPGAKVSAIARSNRVGPSQLFARRRNAVASGLFAWARTGSGEAVKFVRFEAARIDMIEIIVGEVVVRDGGDVEAARLAEVIRAFCRA
jgi:transposase